MDTEDIWAVVTALLERIAVAVEEVEVRGRP